jgi:aryl-alcohol dehydrogenase-like predicted oxidoreductase
MVNQTSKDASAAGSFALGGDLPVNRLGFGAMQLPGPEVWGPSRDHAGALRVLRRAVELGVNLIDTADAYGPYVSEELIAEALHPYPADLVIATKGGLIRTGPGEWPNDGRPEHLRAACEGSLRRLKLERIDLYQFHSPDPRVPFADSVGALADLQAEGKIRHIGLSNVSVAQIEAARAIAPIASVQNRFNLVDRSSDDVLEYCTQEGIGFMPWYPLATGQLAERGGMLDALAAQHNMQPAQIALAWLLHLAPVMLPIAGTASLAHLEENVAAASFPLDEQTVAALTAMRP